MKEYPEVHQTGTISIENISVLDSMDGRYMQGDFGIQIARDGRVWVCINGLAFLRFSPHPNRSMSK